MALFDYMIGGLTNILGSAVLVGLLFLFIFSLLLFTRGVGLAATFLFMMFCVYLFSTFSIGGNSILPQSILLIPYSISVGILFIAGLVIGLMFYSMFIRE